MIIHIIMIFTMTKTMITSIIIPEQMHLTVQKRFLQVPGMLAQQQTQNQVGDTQS